MNKDDIVVTVPLRLLEDLLTMIHNPAHYREGFAWTHQAMGQANRLANHAVMRNSMYEPD